MLRRLETRRMFATVVERKGTLLPIAPRKTRSRERIGMSIRPWWRCKSRVRPELKKLMKVKQEKRKSRLQVQVPGEDEVEAEVEQEAGPEPEMQMNRKMKPVVGKHSRLASGALCRMGD